MRASISSEAGALSAESGLLTIGQLTMSIARTVALFFGGWSPEREVSVFSAIEVSEVLRSLGHFVIPVLVTVDGRWVTSDRLLDVSCHKDSVSFDEFPSVSLLNRGQRPTLVVHAENEMSTEFIEFDVAIPIFHGVPGEDGAIQGSFEITRTPYVGSGVSASACGVDKILQKTILRDADIPCVDSVTIDEMEWHERPERVNSLVKPLGYPLIVKPSRLGSSIGIEIVEEESDLDRALARAFRFDHRLLVEKFLDSMTEINCAVYYSRGFHCSPCERPLANGPFLSFSDKYIVNNDKISGKTDTAAMGIGDEKRVLPADIDDAIRQRIQQLAVAVAERLGLRGVARIDFMVQGDAIFVNEVNTIPGSLGLYLWKPDPIGAKGVLQAVIDDALDTVASEVPTGPNLIGRHNA